VTGGSGFIGSNLFRTLLGDPAVMTLNLDHVAPEDASLQSIWEQCNVLDRERVMQVFEAFGPTDVIHLAARVDIDGSSAADYPENTDGTTNVIDAATATGVERLIVASTQFVCQPGHVPSADDDYSPHTAYGESKIEAERRTRSSGFPGVWTIVRPTTIWGPGDLRYRAQFYKVMSRGLYLHPSGPPAMRSFGYVGNVVDQIQQILSADSRLVHGQTLYVGDPVGPITDFVEEFAAQFGRPVRTVPRALVRGLASLGDIVVRAGGPFPITSGRFASMTENYDVPIAKTLEITGPPPIPLAQGVSETIEWLRRSGVVAGARPENAK
jgi:nucleoside-diphosphate-sugar epimerase